MKFLQLTSFFLLSFFSVAAEVEEQAPALRPAEQLEQLFAPVALYPDALIAIILPASTFPSDVVLAARFLDANGAVAEMDAQPWDDSIKSLAHYPEVVRWMDQNLAWTKQAGEAFLTQPADVMNAIQRLRARARAAGTLVDTPQQQVVLDQGNIQILPTEPDVIYVPIYDPDIVYVSSPGFYSDPFLTFGAGYATGLWLGYGMDWGYHRVWSIDRRYRERYWHDHHDWRQPPYMAGRPGDHDNDYHRRSWSPSPGYPRPSQRRNYAHPEVVQTEPYHRPASRNPDDRRPDLQRSPGRPEISQVPSNFHRDGRPGVTPVNVERSRPRPTAPAVTTEPARVAPPMPKPSASATSPHYRQNGPDRTARSARPETEASSRVNQSRTRPPSSAPSVRSSPPTTQVRPSYQPPSAPSAPPVQQPQRSSAPESRPSYSSPSRGDYRGDRQPRG